MGVLQLWGISPLLPPIFPEHRKKKEMCKIIETRLDDSEPEPRDTNAH
jgi:hypothetical protein